jgi:gliding motility-associated-like protein
MKNNLYLFFIILFFIFQSFHANAQCGTSTACNANTGIYSNDDATNIAYDNMGSAFHSTYIKETNSDWKIWGEHMSDTGLANVLSPITFNVANYPALTGTIYKMALGSDYIYSVQLIVLTSTGLFALGDVGSVIDSSITFSSNFQKITVNGKADGLPTGVSPADVKMIFATYQTLTITTCSGEVYVLSQYASTRGNGGIGAATQWSQVMQNATTPLTNVIVTRGNTAMAFALKTDGTLWTWGENTLLGNNTTPLSRNFAAQMTLPAGIPGIKMIQATSNGANGYSYYILGNNKNLYTLGSNDGGQLGDRTSTNRLSWVNAKNPNNTIITDAAWISANEHDDNYSGIAVIKTNGVLYTGGENNTYMVGRTIDSGVNYLEIPTGVSATDFITFAEAGGHTCAIIKQCSPRYGYVGHRIDGSMGDGSNTSSTNQSYNFTIPPIINVCGTSFVAPNLTTNNAVCSGQNAVFTITGFPTQIVSYTINGGGIQTITIGTNGTAIITINNVTTNQTINLTQISIASGTCTLPLTNTATVIVNLANTIPTFTPVNPICLGQALTALPLLSNNNISGTWSPPLNNLATTLYTFTPNVGQCGTTNTMTITVNNAIVTPQFTAVNPICAGDALAALPTISNNSILGTWSPALNNLATTLYTFTPASGTCIANQTMTIVVNPANVIPAFPVINSICSGQTLAALPTTSNNNITGVWSPALNNLATTLYTFTPNAGQCANISQITIVVNPLRTPLFNTINPICAGDPLVALSTTSTNNITGSWSPTLNNLATTTYNFTPTSGQCANSNSLTIVVRPLVTPTFNAIAPICYGEIAPVLPTISTNTINGSWQPSTISNTLSGSYVFTPTSGQCTILPPVVNVVVYNNFDFEIIQECIDHKLYLKVIALSNSFDVNTATINWLSSSNTVLSLNTAVFNVTDYVHSVSTIPQLPVIFNVNVTLPNGCSVSHNKSIPKIYCDIQRGISPNGDGDNEFFDLELMDVKKLEIFNRYGIKVYSKQDYKTQWVGQTDSGLQLPDGTYYYVIDFNTDRQSATGWIYLNREK